MERIPLLSDLPEPILIHILSKLSDGKEVVRSSVLSTQWRYLWKSVPVSICFCIPKLSSEKEIADFVASANRELHSWSCCKKIRTLKVCTRSFIKTGLVKLVDMWVHFATTVGNVEEFKLECDGYELPLFSFKNAAWKNLVIRGCKLQPSGTVHWTNLVSILIRSLDLTEGILEKVLSGCPNLECLKMVDCQGFHRLKISSVKLKKLKIIQDYEQDESYVDLLEICSPCLQNMKLSGFFCEIDLQNVTSLVNAHLDISFYFQDGEDRPEEELLKFKGLFHSVAHVENLELGPWCSQHLLKLGLKGWLFPSSRWNFLLLKVRKQLEFPGICSVLQSSPVLETLVIRWFNDEPRDLVSRNNTNEEHLIEANSPLLHLKTIKMIYYQGLSSGDTCLLSLVKYFLKNATVLERLVISADFEGRDASQNYIKIAKEFLRFPRSSPHASLVLSKG